MRYNNVYLHEVIKVDCLAGRRCFIIGGGPSLKNFDATLFGSEYVIGVNKAFNRFHPQLNYSNDMAFLDMMTTPPVDDVELKQLSSLWKGYTGLKVFRQQIERKNYKGGECLVKEIIEPTISFDLLRGIYCGNNSGFGALMLAVALRANPIYLLGFDLKVKIAGEGGAKVDATHWHGGYPRQTPRQQLKKMQQFKKPFEIIAPELKKLNINVINLGPDSALGCFPEQNWQEVLYK